MYYDFVLDDLGNMVVVIIYVVKFDFFLYYFFLSVNLGNFGIILMVFWIFK